MSKLRLDITSYIDDYWDGWNLNRLQAILAKNGKDLDEIEVVLNSPGGIATEGIAMYNELRKHAAAVTVYVRGLAASAASILAMAADRIVMEEGALLMIHNASLWTGGTSEEMEHAAAVLAKVDDQMAGIYARRSGQSRAQIRSWMADTTWFTSSEAVEAGLADETEEAGADLAARVAASASDLLRHIGARARLPERVAAMVAISRDLTAAAGGGGGNPARDGAGESNKGGHGAMAKETGEGNKQQDQPTATPAAGETVRAATVQEIRAACPDATPEFVLEQLEAQATLDQVRSAYTAALSERLKAAESALSELRAQGNGQSSAGVPPVHASTGEFAGDDDPVALWKSALKAKLAEGMSRAQAVRAVDRENPGLREAYVAALN